MPGVTSVVVIGGGPGGYEAALVGRQLGADVTLIERLGIGGSAVLTDCVPSKALIASAGLIASAQASHQLGVLINGSEDPQSAVGADFGMVNARVRDLARAQSDDITHKLVREGVHVVHGTARLLDASTVEVAAESGAEMSFVADNILIATGTRPRVLADAMPDGERILTWEQVYDLPELPEQLIVVGSGVTGAEFASAYHALGSDVTLISSRDRVLPGEDADAAAVLESVFERKGLRVLSRSRAVAARNTGDGVEVTLSDGQTIHGSHVLMAVGQLPNTENLGLENAGVAVNDGGYITVDRVSRTNIRGIYAAGDCTGVLPLASVAAMQGRIAMWHALGDAVTPLDVKQVCSNIFTDPEIATVGYTQNDLESGLIRGDIVMLPLAGNARAKMQGITDGFVKIICRRGTRIVAGAVVVGPNASELIHALTIAVDQKLTADQVAQTFTVYPSLSGSIAEAARRLHVTE